MTDGIPCARSVTGVYYYAFMQELSRKVPKNRPQLLVTGRFILHDNARPQIADVLIKILRDIGLKVLPHAPYSPDKSPPDFDLFPNLEESMRERFSSLEEKLFDT